MDLSGSRQPIFARFFFLKKLKRGDPYFLLSFVKPDCVIAKVDGPGLVDLLRIFAKKYHSHLYIFLYILAYVGHILFKIDS